MNAHVVEIVILYLATSKKLWRSKLGTFLSRTRAVAISLEETQHGMIAFDYSGAVRDEGLK